jgi:hopene-associated glycosyltransferase HpnB
VSAGLVAVAGLAIWLYLLLGRGLFWRAAECDDALVGADDDRIPGPHLPSVTAIVPARNEAEHIAASVDSLFRQNYPGRFDIVLVDDQSTDGTGEIALHAAKEHGASERLTLLRGAEPPAGWAGKLWAMHQGFQHVSSLPQPPDFVLFTDADIAYAEADVVERLVRGAQARGNVLTSLMVKLRCETFAERLLVPAFIFFFAKLYPFAWANDPRRKLAAAAGGCMLVKREALQDAGGLQTIRGALIDDCALAALLKKQGPIWLGLTQGVVSLRPYAHFRDFRRMVVRSAYTELRHSPLRLACAALGMTLTYLAPPPVALFAGWPAWVIAAAAWALMMFAYVPTLRFYGRSPLWALALPVIAALYTAFTIESAVQHWRGRGGAWKGRLQAASIERTA